MSIKGLVELGYIHVAVESDGVNLYELTCKSIRDVCLPEKCK